MILRVLHIKPVGCGPSSTQKSMYTCKAFPRKVFKKTTQEVRKELNWKLIYLILIKAEINEIKNMTKIYLIKKSGSFGGINNVDKFC